MRSTGANPPNEIIHEQNGRSHRVLSVSRRGQQGFAIRWNDIQENGRTHRVLGVFSAEILRSTEANRGARYDELIPNRKVNSYRVLSVSSAEILRAEGVKRGSQYAGTMPKKTAEHVAFWVSSAQRFYVITRGQKGFAIR